MNTTLALIASIIVALTTGHAPIEPHDDATVLVLTAAYTAMVEAG